MEPAPGVGEVGSWMCVWTVVAVLVVGLIGIGLLVLRRRAGWSDPRLRTDEPWLFQGCWRKPSDATFLPTEEERKLDDDAPAGPA
jgi:hypothetical protein